MTLKDAKNGEIYVVEDSIISQPVKRRLEAMGLIEGTLIRKNNQALDGSIIFMVRGTRLAIGKELAQAITVKKALASDLGKGRRGYGPGHGRRRGPGMGHRKGCGKGQAMGRQAGKGCREMGVDNW
ncbi:MAG TPA: FeoA family protein [Bacillota bacterium]|nr:FeoA family protein [Bacillota bacterium]